MKRVIYEMPLNEVAKEIKMSMTFVRMAVQLGKFRSKKVGQLYLVPREDVENFKKIPFQISRKEAYHVGDTERSR